MTQTRPVDALRILHISTTESFPGPHHTLAFRYRIAVAYPYLADDMRMGSLAVYCDAPSADFDPDTTPDTRSAYIEWREHVDPLNPDATVTRVATVPIQTIEHEIAVMRDRGAIPGYIATAALRDLRADV